jgi:hypothetical protein
MNTWWLVLISLSRSDSATTGFGNSGYQSWGARLAVIAIERLGDALGDQPVEVVGLSGSERQARTRWTGERDRPASDIKSHWDQS